MTYAEMFDKIKSMLDNADVSAQREHLRYQFNITGESGGDVRKHLCERIGVV